MSAQDRIRWDDIFKKRAQAPFPKPSPLLVDRAPAPSQDEPRALDVAAGLGHNTIWLAEQGYTVDMMDISRVALQRARTEMALRNLRNINLLQVDIDDLILRRSGYCDAIHEICPESYDLIVIFRYLRRSLLPILNAATKSGGHLIYETFNRQYLEEVPDFNQDFLLEVGELETAFINWRFVHYDESTYLTQMVAVKP